MRRGWKPVRWRIPPPETKLSATRRALGALIAIAALTLPAAGAAHVPPDARGGEPIAERITKREMIAARERFFGERNVNGRTGAVRRDRVILSWFGVTNFAMAIRGKVVLLDAWVPRGAHSGYVPTDPAELAALRPKLVVIGHAHFDHAADAVPIALASGARLVGTAEHCADFHERAAPLAVRCLEAVPAGAEPGTSERLRPLRGVRIKAVKHLHSGPTFPDGYHVPVTPAPSTTTLENPPTVEDMIGLFGHLPDSEGGSVLYRFRVHRFELVWHDSAGPLVDNAPETFKVLRRMAPVDVQVGAIQGFNQLTNGLRDPRTYIEALRPRTFVPTHHDDWAAGITTKGAAYEPYLEAELEQIPEARRPRVRFISDPGDYVRPRGVTWKVRKPR